MEILDKRQLKKNSNPGVFVVTILLSVLLILFVLWPKFNAYNTDRKALNAAKADLATLSQQKDIVNQTLQDLQQDSNDVSKLNDSIPSQQNIPDVFALIESLAQASNLKVGTMQVNEPAKPGNAPSIAAPAVTTAAPVVLPSNIGSTDLSVEVIGTIDGFNQFLASIENSLRIMDVQSIDVASVKERPGQISFKVNLKTYYQK